MVFTLDKKKFDSPKLFVKTSVYKGIKSKNSTHRIVAVNSW